jgi:nucleotide-binding universal stress UspA family protein
MDWLPKGCVVVPVDFSDESLAAVNLALDLVEDASQVHVLHVLAELSYAEKGFARATVDSFDQDRRQYAEGVLRKALVGPQYAKVQQSVAIGDAGREIVDYAQKAGAELIVIPSHGRTGLKRLLIGSVAERVLRLAHCPVLVLRS